MTDELKKRIPRVYGIVLSASIVIAGICLMASCVDIYRSGDHPYSREVVAAHFSTISVPVYLCLALVIGGFILELAIPDEAKKRTPAKQDAPILKRLQEKTDLNLCDEALRDAVRAEQKKRRLRRNLTLGLLALGAVIFLAYVFSGDRFQMPDINGSMIHAMTILVPSMAVPCGFAIWAAYANRKSVQAEIALLKTAPAEAKKAAVPSPEKARKDHTSTLRGVIVLIAIALLLYGYFTGGTMDILTKAINICTECVGLG